MKKLFPISILLIQSTILFPFYYGKETPMGTIAALVMGCMVLAGGPSAFAAAPSCATFGNG